MNQEYIKNSRKYIIYPEFTMIKLAMLFCALWIGITPAQAVIDFETLPSSSNTIDGQKISNQYSGSDAVIFSLRVRGTGPGLRFQNASDPKPTIAQVGGDTATAFLRKYLYNHYPDSPAPTQAGIVKQRFLTDDGSIGLNPDGTEPAPILFIEYNQSVGGATGDIIDTDGPEAWLIEAYSVPNPTYNDQPISSKLICGKDYTPVPGINCYHTEKMDGEVVPWALTATCPLSIRSIAISYVGNIQDPARKVGLGFDNFEADARTCEQPPNLTITKTADGPLPWQANGSGSYQVVVTNSGGPIQSGSIFTMQDNMPNSLILNQITPPTGSDWACNQQGVCSLTVPQGTTIPTGKSWTFTVNVGVSSTFGGGSIENCADATLHSEGGSEISVSNCDTVNVNPFLQPTITKSANGPMPWQVGGTGSFTLDVTVPSNIPAGQDIAFHDILPAGFTIVPGSFSPLPSPGMTCYDSTGICHLAGPIAAGTNVSVTFDVQLPGEAGDYKNCSEVTLATNFNPESQWNYRPVPQSCINVNLVAPPLPPTIEKTVLGSLPWQAGGTGQFSLAVNVSSGIPAGQTIAIQDVLPVGFTLVPGSLVTVPSTGWNCVPSTGICYLDGPIAANSNINVVFAVHVPEAIGTYLNCAEVAITNPYNVDSPPAFNSLGKSCKKIDVKAVPICTPAKLNIKKTHQPASFMSGGTGNIGITVTNNGSNPIFAPIQVTDQLPAGLSIAPGSFSPSADLACVAGPASPSPQQINCSYMGAALSAGGSFSIPLQVQVSPRARMRLKNHASVTKGCCGSKVNDTTTDNIPVHRITHPPVDPLPIKTGQICGKKVNARNEGLLGWVITATNQAIPHTYEPVATKADGTYCITNLPAGNYTVSEQIPGLLNGWLWEAVDPASGSHSNINLAVNQIKNGVDFKNKKKKIIDISDIGISVSDQHRKPVANGGTISITKKHSPSHFSTGSKGIFTIKVTNQGKSLTKGMFKVIDHMPVGLTVKSGKFTADLWSCEGGMVSSSGQDVTCVFNKTLRKNRWSAIKLNTSIASEGQFPAAMNVVKNCATVSVRNAAGAMAAGPKVCDKVRIKHVESSGSSSIPIVPRPATSPSVSIEKKHSPSRFSTGSRGAFKIVVKNKGAKLAKGMLKVVDRMPSGLSVKTGSFRANSWSCKGGMVSSSGQDVTCTYNRTLGKNSRATLNLNVTVASADRFPADVNEVENCATASVLGAANSGAMRGSSVINGNVKVEKATRSVINGNIDVKDSTIPTRERMVCDKVKIRHAKSRGSFNLPIGIGIGLGGLGSGGGGGANRGAAR